MPKKAAVVGLGSMGGAMATALLRARWEVSGYDPSPAASSAAEAAGIRIVEALEQVAGTPYIVLSLPSARVVEQAADVLLQERGTLAIVDTSTSEPDTSQALAERAAAQGTAFIDSPVSGGRDGALAGRLAAFVGGTPEAVEAAAPVLQALTSGQYQHLGGPGSGNVVKLLNNVLAAANLISVGEALSVAQAYGVDPKAAAESISGASGGSKVSAAMYPNWILSGTHDSGFALGLMARDAALAVDVAQQRGEHPSLLAQASQRWQEALSALGPRADFTEIARIVAPTLTREGVPSA